MTLQNLIDGLRALDPATIAPKGFHNPHSWRGVYAELAFEPTEGPVSVGEMLATAESALGQTYEGWKGGDFTMSGHTDVHIDYEGQYGGSDMMELWFATLSALKPATPTPASSVLVGEAEQLTDEKLALLKAAMADENAAYKSGSITWAVYYKEACELAYSALPALLAERATRPAPLSLLGSGDAPAVFDEEGALSIVHEVLNDWLEENEATDFDENDVAHLFGMLGTAGYSIVPNALAARLTPASAAASTGGGAGQAQDARSNNGTTCRSCAHTDLTADFGVKCPECGGQDLEKWHLVSAEVLDNLLLRAAAAHEGPYSVEILGDRTRWLKTNGGSNIHRKLLSEHELNELKPFYAQRHRATDAYMAAADPQTITNLVKEVLDWRSGTHAAPQHLVVGEAAAATDTILAGRPVGEVRFYAEYQVQYRTKDDGENWRTLDADGSTYEEAEAILNAMVRVLRGREWRIVHVVLKKAFGVLADGQELLEKLLAAPADEAR